MTPPFKFPRPCDDNMLCVRCQRFDIQAFGRDTYPYRRVSLLSVIRSSNHCSFCSLLLESLRNVGGYVIDRYGGWVYFTVTKATKQPAAGSRGLNVASIDASVRYNDLLPSDRDVKFHVAADPGKMPLFLISDPGY